MSTVRLMILIVLWFVQAGVVVLLVDAEWLKKQTSAERIALEKHLGQRRYERIAEHSRAIYQRWFSNFAAQSYEKLLPAKPRASNDLNLAPGFFRWLHRRLDALWDIVYQAIYRIALLRDWSLYLAGVMCAALTDGLVRRKLKQANHHPPSNDLYTIARRAVIVLLFAPLIFLSLPLCIPPALVPAWGCLLAVSLILLTANAQQHI